MINCPLAFGVCDEICRNYSEQGCGYFFPVRPWNDILTIEERIERIERGDFKVEHFNHTHTHSYTEKPYPKKNDSSYSYIYSNIIESESDEKSTPDSPESETRKRATSAQHSATSQQEYKDNKDN